MVQLFGLIVYPFMFVVGSTYIFLRPTMDYKRKSCVIYGKLKNIFSYTITHNSLYTLARNNVNIVPT